MKTIAVAGASGYIGSKLIKILAKNYKVLALSRSSKVSEDENIKWVAADLFSMRSTSSALENADIAIYLVHSMLPSTKLFQGNFHDTDLILADNFAKACQKNNVKQIIYIGGILPSGFVSEHLKSRQEVEEVLRATGIPVSILRAGMVVGNGGSSFEILKNLVINLPAMVLPKWTSSVTQIIFLNDLLDIIAASVDNRDFFDKTVNVVNGEKLKYKQLIEQTCEYLGKKKPLIPIPINYTKFSKMWVTFFGESNYELVSPLITSLLCDFSLIKPDPLILKYIKFKTYKDMLQEITITKTNSRKSNRKIFDSNTVRSIQRLGQDSSIKATQAASAYMDWLPNHMRGLISVQSKGDHVYFTIPLLDINLLELMYINDEDEKDRVKFHIIGGILSKTGDTGWLEFRSVANDKFLLASINEFVPSLPWYIYKYTQAPVHKLVMHRFGRSLRK